MARVTVEDCLDQVDNRFALVLLATKRTRMLLSGKKPLIDAKNKEPVIALREIASGKVTYNENIKDILVGKIPNEPPADEKAGER
ncbi:MAG: hypothetical protein Kow0090_02150 [Myxococcota bacterium]